jgi:hypothetical protein
MTISDAGLADLNAFRDVEGANARLALEERAVFGDLVTAYPSVIGRVQTNLDHLRRHGVREAITRTLSASEVV